MKIKCSACIILLLTSVVLTSCGLWSDDEASTQPVEPMQSDTKISSSSPAQEAELKIAKLWNRVDELEDALSKQRQRMAVLERGLLLGVIPDELKNPVDLAKQKEAVSNPTPTVMLSKNSEQNETSPIALEKIDEKTTNDQKLEQQPTDMRQKKIQEAQQFFEQGQYGRAIALYAAIDDASDPELSHRYWTALSWYRLKEYDTAQKEFNELVQRAAASQWVPRAHYYLAQIDLEQGLREQGLSKLQKLIELHPDADAAQMARSVIAKLEKNL